MSEQDEEYVYGFHGDNEQEVCLYCRKVLEALTGMNGTTDVSIYETENPKITYKGVSAFARHMHGIYEKQPSEEKVPVEVCMRKRDSILWALNKGGVILPKYEKELPCGDRKKGCPGLAVYKLDPRQFRIFEHIETWLKAEDVTNPFHGLEWCEMSSMHREMLFMEESYHAKANLTLSSDHNFEGYINWGDTFSSDTLHIGEMNINESRLADIRKIFANGTMTEDFKDPVLVLAFMVFMANILQDVERPYVLLGGHGSLPGNGKIRNYVTVSKGNTVTLASPGFLAQDFDEPNRERVTTEYTCDERIWHRVPVGVEGERVVEGPQLDLNDHKGVAYTQGEKFLDIEVSPFNMMLCGSLNVEKHGDNEPPDRDIRLPLSMSFFRKLVLNEVPAYGAKRNTHSVGEIMNRLEAVMRLVAPNGFHLNAKCCAAHPSFETIYPARYQFLMMTLNYEKAMINMLRTDGEGVGDNSKPESLQDFLLIANQKSEIPAMLKVPKIHIEAALTCTGLGHEKAPSEFSSSLMTVIYMAYIETHYGVKCGAIANYLAAGNPVPYIVSHLLREISARNDMDPAKLILVGAAEETAALEAASKPESDAAGFGFGFRFGEDALDKSPEELDTLSGSLQAPGASNPSLTLQGLHTAYLAIMEALGILGIVRTMKIEVREAGFAGGGARRGNRAGSWGRIWRDASYAAGIALSLAVALAGSFAGSVRAPLEG